MDSERNWLVFFMLKASIYSIIYANDEAQVQNVCQMFPYNSLNVFFELAQFLIWEKSIDERYTEKMF